MNAPWLFAEAYKYRRLHECFSISKYWKDYDVFFRQKCDTFSRSYQAVFELSTRFVEPWKYAESETSGLSIDKKTEAERLMFLELTQGKLLCIVNPDNQSELFSSLFMGQLHRPVLTNQHDRGGYQEVAIHWR